MTRGDRPRASELQRRALQAAQEHIKDVELEMMVDPWVAAGLPRPSDAPGQYADKSIGFGQVPLVNRIEIIHYLVAVITGMQSVMNEWVNINPEFREHMLEQMEHLTKLRDVAGEIVEEQETEEQEEEEASAED